MARKLVEPQKWLPRWLSVAAATTLLTQAIFAEEHLLTLEYSTDLQHWQSVAITPEILDGGGSIKWVEDDPVSFFRLSISTQSSPAPIGFARIPAGAFTMGRTSGDVDSDAPPVNIYVSEFYLATHEVTKSLWDEVRIWGETRGFTDISEGSGEGPNHPVHSVNWWDAVKWCNARSAKEGLTPVYIASGTVMRTGTVTPVVNWSANGYRLPTEAEWEKAARGGYSGQRFPWGDSINHSNANYIANGSAYEYDTSFYSIDTFHPSYDDGVPPYTSEVGSFQENGYGIYAVADNVHEWCWDWYSESTYSEGTSDPKGPASELHRVFRGGSWSSDARFCRSAGRNRMNPDYRNNRTGLRPARNSAP